MRGVKEGNPRIWPVCLQSPEPYQIHVIMVIPLQNPLRHLSSPMTKSTMFVVTQWLVA